MFKTISDADLESKVQSWTADLNARLNSVIGRTRVPLKASNLTSHHIESTLLNLITDAFIEKVSSYMHTNYTYSEKQKGPITINPKITVFQKSSFMRNQKKKNPHKLA